MPNISAIGSSVPEIYLHISGVRQGQKTGQFLRFSELETFVLLNFFTVNNKYF